MTTLVPQHVAAMRAALTDSLEKSQAACGRLGTGITEAGQAALGEPQGEKIAAASGEFTGLIASLAASYAWSIVVGIIEANKDADTSIEDLIGRVSNVSVSMTLGLCTPATLPGVIWRTFVASSVAAIVQRMHMLVQAEATCRKLCDDIGVDFASFQSGDPNAVRLVTEAAQRLDATANGNVEGAPAPELPGPWSPPGNLPGAPDSDVVRG